MKEQEICSFLTSYVNSLNTNNPEQLNHTGFISFLQEFFTYFSSVNEMPRIGMMPCLNDKTAETALDKYYFYQDTWAARRIFEINPEMVVDVGSTALLAGVISQKIPTISIDIRPLPVNITGLTCRKGSITDLPFNDESLELLSSMCVIEHIGLGRYGDMIDTDGSIKAFNEVSRVIRKGGHFIFSVPLSHTPGVVFNAHRIFSKVQVLSLLPDFELQNECFLFPEPYGEEFVDRIQGLQFCVWCAHMIKREIS